MKTYSYNGYKPYGAGDLFCLDQYVDYDFDGNVTEEILKNEDFKFIENRGGFLDGENIKVIEKQGSAVLMNGNEVIASFVKE